VLRAFAISTTALAFAAAGCSGECDGVYHCPPAVNGEVAPLDGGATVSNVRTDPPCKAFPDPISPGSLVVQFNGTIPDGTTRTCVIRAKTSDGSEVEASVSFQPLPCCGSNTSLGGPVAFKPAGGGADAAQD
jgi:hypothetical protein